jgi:hypothetical protein
MLARLSATGRAIRRDRAGGRARNIIVGRALGGAGVWRALGMFGREIEPTGWLFLFPWVWKDYVSRVAGDTTVRKAVLAPHVWSRTM